MQNYFFKFYETKDPFIQQMIKKTFEIQFNIVILYSLLHSQLC